MKKVFTPQKAEIGDIVHPSDQDSDILITENLVEIEDMISVETPFGFYIGRIIFIDSATMEIEILEKVREKDPNETPPTLTVIQSVSYEEKFTYFLEKCVEVGVNKIYPVYSKHSIGNYKQYQKSQGLWRKVVKDAIKQSRSSEKTELENITKLNKLKLSSKVRDSIKILLTTEPTDSVKLRKAIQSDGKILKKDVTLAVGPEKGWSSKDIKYFEENGFMKIRLDGNILRTETAAVVVGSIVKFRQGLI